MCNIVGISYNGKDLNGNAKWYILIILFFIINKKRDRVKVIRFWKFKFSQNGKSLIENWNITTQLWLKNCILYNLIIIFLYYFKNKDIYLRLVDKKINKTISALITFFISSIWHVIILLKKNYLIKKKGFYPGYYLFFLSIGFTIQFVGNSKLLFFEKIK